MVVGLDGEAGVESPYWCEIYADGYPNQFFGQHYEAAESIPALIKEKENTETGEHILLPGIHISGVSWGPVSPAPEGGTIYVYSSSQVVAVPIEAEGTYQAAGLPPGEVVVWAQVPGLGTTYYPDSGTPDQRVPVLEEGADVSGVDLFMPEESVLSLSLTAAQEADFSEVSVLLYSENYTVGKGMAADSSGKVVLSQLYPGNYWLQIYGASAGFVDGMLQGEDGPELLAIEGEISRSIQLLPGASVSGVVRDETGKKLVGVDVLISSTDYQSFNAVTDQDGYYEIRGLPAGDWRLYAAFSPLCLGDPGWVAAWWGGVYQGDASPYVSLETGEQREDVDFVLLRDNDHDGMGDGWEEEEGLDTERDDSLEDADGDGFSNLEEFWLGTDPTDEAGGGGVGCGCGGGRGIVVLLLAVGRRGRRGR
jgi:hypothetical protein